MCDAVKIWNNTPDKKKQKKTSTTAKRQVTSHLLLGVVLQNMCI